MAQIPTFSLSQLAREFNASRETVKKRLDEYGAEPSEVYRGNPRYRLRDAVRAMMDTPVTDPDDLPPAARLAWYRADHIKFAIQEECKTLVEREDIEQTYRRRTAQMLGQLQLLENDATIAAVLDERQLERFRRHLQDCRRAVESLEG